MAGEEITERLIDTAATLGSLCKEHPNVSREPKR
jgi:hypothetical protein